MIAHGKTSLAKANRPKIKPAALVAPIRKLKPRFQTNIILRWSAGGSRVSKKVLGIMLVNLESQRIKSDLENIALKKIMIGKSLLTGLKVFSG